MKLNYKVDVATVFINKNKKLYYCEVARDILTFGEWAQELENLSIAECPGVCIYNTDIIECYMVYVENNDVYPIVKNIDNVGKYLVLGDLEYEEFRNINAISDKDDENFKRMFGFLNDMLEDAFKPKE